MNNSPPPSTAPPRRILVVDDADAVAETIQVMLSDLGHAVEVSGDGQDALNRFAPGKYDLIITDYSMPKMNGLELAQAIKKRAVGQLILLVTAFTFTLAADDEQPLPVDFVLPKPFLMEELHEAVARLFLTSAKAK
jgi:CheY-like chemotaxis protein